MERKLITDGFNDLGRLRRSTAKKEASRIEVINATTVSLIIIKKSTSKYKASTNSYLLVLCFLSFVYLLFL